jgi:NAD(P)-dependent dehydrogenase (short-subunit alcohol dehydrogenase family)
MHQFDGERVAITGGGSGIGRQTALRFARAGARVAVLDVAAAHSDAVAREIRDGGGDALAFGLDVRDSKAVRTSFDAIFTAWGGLDILVCAAGILRSGQLATLDLDVWDEVQSVNVKGVLIACQEAIRQMKKGPSDSARRKIAVVASASAFAPKVGLGAYATSKLALVQIVRVLAAELAAQGINVNAVAPGTIATPMVQERLAGSNDGSGFKLYGTAPVGRMGQPADVAEALAYLCSPQSDFVTGSVLSIDGGTTAVFQA